MAQVDGRHVLIFNCLTQDMSMARREETPGGIWAVPIDSPTGPYDVARAHLLADPRLYVGKLVVDRASGTTQFLAFRNVEDGEFVGALADPQHVEWQGDRLVIRELAQQSSDRRPRRFLSKPGIRCDRSAWGNDASNLQGEVEMINRRATLTAIAGLRRRRARLGLSVIVTVGEREQ